MLKERYNTMVQSEHRHTVRFPEGKRGENMGGTAGPGDASNNKFHDQSSEAQCNGEGVGSFSKVDPTATYVGLDTAGNEMELSGKSMMAHEVLGHGYDRDQGPPDLSMNSATGYPRAEDSAVEAGNAYRRAVGENERERY